MGYKIAIVDDEQKILDSLKRYFELRNYSVQTFNDPTKALQSIKSMMIKIVILDINMPEMDGLELLSKLKRHNEKIQVIIITGNATAENVQRAMKDGALGFIVKPFDSLQSIEALVEKGVDAIEKKRVIKYL